MKRKGHAFVSNGNESPFASAMPAVRRVLIVTSHKDKFLSVPTQMRPQRIDVLFDDNTLHSLEGFHLVLFVNPNTDEERATEFSRMAVRENVRVVHMPVHQNLIQRLRKELF